MTREDRPRDTRVSRVNATLLVFLAEALVAPTGLVTIIYLSRRLGAEPYGVYALAAVVVGWAQVMLVSLLGRAAQGFVARTHDWRPAAADIVYLYLLAGAAGALIVFVIAGPLALLLKAPALAGNLRLFALDILLFTIAQGVRSVVLATGRFRLQAAMAAVRWISRMVLVCGLVALGFGVRGAIIGGLAASSFELALGLAVLRLPPPHLSLGRLAGFWRMAAPLSVSGVGLRMFEKVDILVVQALAGPLATGLYGVAQNVMIVAGVFSASFSAAVLTQVSRLHADAAAVARTARAAFRTWTRLAPPAALGAALAPDLVRFAFGHEFAGAGPLVAVLAFAALAMIGVSLAISILVGAGHGRLVLLATFAALPVAVAGHLILVPRFGALGAAACTTAVAWATAGLIWTGVHSRTGFRPPRASLARNLGVGVLVLAAGAWGPVALMDPVSRAAILSTGMAAALCLTGEVRLSDIREWIGAATPSGRNP